MAITKDEQLSSLDTSSSALFAFTKGNVIFRMFSNDQNKSIKAQNKIRRFTWIVFRCGNDPSAGSPTETLLRLHLPLNGEV